MKTLETGIGAAENTAPHDNEEEAHQFFLPFRGFCARKGVRDQSLFSPYNNHIYVFYITLISLYIFFSDYSNGGSSS